jgi:hypothetical protein
MNRCFFVVVLAVIGIAGAALLASCTGGRGTPLAFATEPEAASSGGPPPLVIDEDSPLLLEEPSEVEALPAEAIAKNSPCYVCHVNYQAEPLALQHAKAEVGCVDCHGESFPHRNDENNTTPPDTMYPADKIDASCQECHDTHDAPAKDVIALWLERHPGKKDAGSIVCTDCHGEHRLTLRTVRWDKKTGKLLTGEKED